MVVNVMEKKRVIQLFIISVIFITLFLIIFKIKSNNLNYNKPLIILNNINYNKLIIYDSNNDPTIFYGYTKENLSLMLNDPYFISLKNDMKNYILINTNTSYKYYYYFCDSSKKSNYNLCGEDYLNNKCYDLYSKLIDLNYFFHKNCSYNYLFNNNMKEVCIFFNSSNCKNNEICKNFITLSYNKDLINICTTSSINDLNNLLNNYNLTFNEITCKRFINLKNLILTNNISYCYNIFDDKNDQNICIDYINNSCNYYSNTIFIDLSIVNLVSQNSNNKFLCNLITSKELIEKCKNSNLKFVNYLIYS